MWIPLTESSDRQGGQVRLFAGPKYVKVKDKWYDIVATRKLTENNGVFRLRFLSEHMNFELVDSKDLVKRVIIKGSRFGHVFDANTRPASVEYRVTGSKGMKRIENGWEITKGMVINLRDWFKNFPGKVDLRDDRVILDLTGAQADEFDEINLDPTVQVQATASGYLQRASTESWANAVQNTGTFDADDKCRLWDNFDTPVYSCLRIVARFDTRTYPSIKTAQLVLTLFEVIDGANTAVAIFCGNNAFGSTVVDMANFPIIRAAKSTPPSLKERTSTDDGTTWTFADFAGDYSAIEKFDVGVYDSFWEAGDGATNTPANGDFNKLGFYSNAGATPPYLLIEPIFGMGATIRTTSTTRRRL